MYLCVMFPVPFLNFPSYKGKIKQTQEPSNVTLLLKEGFSNSLIILAALSFGGSLKNRPPADLKTQEG